MIRNLCAIISIILLLVASPSFARTTLMVGENPLGVQGYFSQSVQSSTEGDHWDTEQGMNAVTSNLFYEGDMRFNSNWEMYGSTMVTVDWIYQFKNHEEDWEKKQFNKSKDLNVDDEWWQLLKELHVTYNPGNFFLRVGKQRVSWGEMEIFAVNDIINPTDQRRGFSEIELETLIVPIPLVRAGYGFDGVIGPISDINLQFVFNPNVDFIGNQGTFYGNDEAGIWAVDLVSDFGYGPWRIGRQDLQLEEPDSWDSDGYEYGVKLSSLISSNTLLSVMGFNGRSNIPVSTFGADLAVDSFTVFDDDGIPIVNLKDTGKYKRQKFIGAALATQIPLKITSLGSFEPVFRLEGSYQIDNYYFDFTSYDFVKTDQIVLGMNFDYKIKVPWQKQFINIFYEFQYNKLQDYESNWDISTASIYRDDYFSHYAWISTGYFRGEWEPSISWYTLDNVNVQIWTPGLTYYHSDTWQLALKANFFVGSDIEDWGFANKDNIVFKVQYQF